MLNIPTEKTILAYGGAGDALRAYLSGEINMGAMGTAGHADGMAPYVARGEATLAFQSGLLDESGKEVPDPGLPAGVPTVTDLYTSAYGKPPSGNAWDAYKALVVAAGAFNYSLYLPPGTPDNIVKAYWDAAEKMVKEAEFLKTSAPLAGPAAKWKTGEAFDKAFKANFGVKPEDRDWYRSTMAEYGVTID